jgi:poly-gamma-glutamate synthesis protein (capsule biosynthesis protein)
MNPLRKAALAVACIAVIIIALSQIPGVEVRYLHPFSPPSQPRPAHADIIFGGDMMFDRTLRTYAARYGGDSLFACLDPLFSKADLVVANLEGPITANPSISLNSAPGDGNNYTFTFPTTTAPLLLAHNVGVVSIGNNHIMNFGRDGLAQTKRALTAAGVGYFGDPDSLESERVGRRTVGGIPFSFINWSDWTSDNTDITGQQVAVEKAAGRVVVVYAHWGEEYLPATDREKRLARTLVDQGADIVLGSHPHVVQEHEVYHGKHIFYSLGNLIFDQYWNDAVSHGLLVRVSFDIHGVSGVEEIPVVLQRNRQTCPVSEVQI